MIRSNTPQKPISETGFIGGFLVIWTQAAGIAPNTMTRLRRDEEVTLTVLNRICAALDVNIGDVMEFTNGERDRGYDG